MKRILSIALGLSLVGGALAQAGFTIRRPLNGSIVRETVNIRIPKRSIPSGGYIGISVNGKFLEAVAPTEASDYVGDDFVYKLDTKDRKLADGNLKIDAVLYGDFGAQGTRALNRSSVRVVLDNRASIVAPAGGFKLRYNFTPGREFVYNMEYRQSTSVMSEAQAKLGGRAPDLQGGFFKARWLYAFDNRYPSSNGRNEGLLRMMVLPDKGKDYAVLPLVGDPTPKKRFIDQFYPIYMRVSDTGREIFGRAPVYFGMEGSTGEGTSKTYIWGNFPLPILPTVGVRPGDSWAGAITESALANLGDVWGMEKVSTPIPARGTLESIEYERGMRCALISNKIATTRNSRDGAQQEIEERYWFSLDKGMVVKVERISTTTTIIKAPAPSAGSGGGGAAGGGAVDENGAPVRKRGLGSAGGTGRDYGSPPPTDIRQASGEDGERPGAARGGRGGGGRGPSMGGGGGRPGGGGGGRQGNRIVKARTQFILTLE